MAFLKDAVTRSMALIVALTIGGCASAPPKAEAWKLPSKKNAESAMIIGRIGAPGNAAEDSDNVVREVVIKNHDFGFYSQGHGEENFIMDNSYYVVPNLKPGRYNFFRFVTDNASYKVSDKDEIIELKPGQILYLGSLDFIPHEQSFSEKFRNKGTYELKRAPHPSELEMLQWLRRVGKGSGWEKYINTRIRALGGE